MRWSRRFGGAIAALGVALAAVAAAPSPERGDAMVSADHPLASQAGAKILALGGNAADAAVATALAAGVVQPSSSGLGGGGFALWVDGAARGVIDFREMAPGAATRDVFLDPDGGVRAGASRIGGLAVAVPGESRGLARLLATRGTMRPAQVAAPAIELASRGFPMGAHLYAAVGRTTHPEVRALLTVGGERTLPGQTFKRPDLARTLKRWASTAGEDLHTGEGARAIADAVSRTGGILSSEDLAAYAPIDRAPLVGAFRERTIVSMGPPSSGGVALLQMLAALDGFDLAAMGHNSSAYIHVLAEVMQHAYADRAAYLGDADVVDVPVERLLSEQRRDEIRRAVWPARTFPRAYYGAPIEPHRDAGTQHISVVDGAGRAVALTTTVNTSFGSGVVPEGLGIVLNNEMDDFSAAPGVPNAYGLVGSEANAVAPGKRPLSSMTPTVVLDADGAVVMAIGASGGSFIISSVLQVFLNLEVFGMDAQEAVSAPRIHHQWTPESLWIEPDVPADVRQALAARGHVLRERAGFSGVEVVVRDGEGWAGGADPRKDGWPAGVWLR